MTGERVELPAADVQLVDAYLHETTLARHDASEVEQALEHPTLEVGLKSITTNPETPHVFVAMFEILMVAPYNEARAIAELRVSAAAIFHIGSPEATDLPTFATREALLIAYPYLRAMVGQLWRMSGIDMPPIPTLNTLGAIGVMDAARKQLEAMTTATSGPDKRQRKQRAPAAKRQPPSRSRSVSAPAPTATSADTARRRGPARSER